MRLVPVGAFPGLDYERHRKLAMRFASGFHDRLHDLCSVANLGFRDLEQQLVVHLQQHLRLQRRIGERPWDAAHRALDDVGRRALQGSVDRLPLGPARRAGLASRIPGIKHLRPKIVST